MLKLSTATVVALMSSFAFSSAEASTLDPSYQVLSAASERTFDGRDVAISMFSGTMDDRDYNLTDDVRATFHIRDAGQMIETGAGTWQITARVVADDTAALGEDSGFDLVFTYNDILDFTPEFKHEATSVEHGNETYINMTGGVMTGFGALSGYNLSVTRMPADGPYATQIGGGILDQMGANNHNSNFGLANWFFVNVEQATCDICIGNDRMLSMAAGDLNVDLVPSPIPVPAAGLLLLSGLVGFGALRRRG